MHPRSLLPLLHCRLCPSPALLHAPVTLHCGHTFCAAHLAPPPDTPSTSRAADASFSLPRCPLPDCSSSSRAPATFSHSPPLDVTVNKLLELLSAPDVQDTPSLVYQDDQDDRTDSEYEVDSDSDLEYLPLPPISPTSSTSQRASSSGRDSHSEERVPSSSPPSVASRHHSRSRSQPSPRLHPRKRRRRLHGRVSPSQPRPQPHRTDHDRQTHLEKELLSELTCEICFGLLWQPITTPCQHTFCTRCLFRSFDHSQTCPLCRQKLPAYDYFQHHPCNKVILDIIRNAFPDAYAERGATIEAEERDARLDTPIFVCQLSFPGMPTMLHFFEPRYRLMLRRCLDSPHPCFGMIPPPRSAPSSTAGASSTGNDYGTMLAIRNVQMLPDGRSLVETWGTWRFRIMERGTLDGYTVARIERIEDYEEELDDGAVPPGEFSADDRREGASPSSARSHPGAIHTPPASSEPTERPSHRRDHEPHTRPGDNGVSEDKVAEGSRATSGPSQAPRAPTNAELMAKCHAFIDQMREGTPWVVQHLNNNYVPMPSDPASFSFWMALLLPIDEHEKAKLLPIRSPRLRLRLVVHWIEQLNSNWWFSGGCVIC
ncbi:PUA-like domain-containing protein [Trametes meyenii]|nr:PUA-like domain-containing protein [Trametes meyenii]